MSRSWLILPLLLLYLWHLGGVGWLGPDEPRYASIGREMALSGDWITPRLDGQPWFEKPPLTYWLTALGHQAGLPDEWAARLPEAMISVAFLLFFYLTLAREYGADLATAATAILATSAGWVAYSFAALTDLPMAAALGGAILLTLFDKQREAWAGTLLGLSILAKGFVPVVLFAPLLLLPARKRWLTVTVACLIAGPWFLLCWSRNGSAFWDDFFWKQHVARFLTPDLEHVQPFWYYVPVALAGFFPWTPLVPLLAQRRLYADVRLRVLALWAVYGFVFFSAARNKLPGYLLPLMPALAIILASALKLAPRKAYWLAACAALLIALPTAGAILPEALLEGLSRAAIRFSAGGLVFAAAALAVFWLGRNKRTQMAILAVALSAAYGICYLKYSSFPAVDASVSVRTFWRLHQNEMSNACLDRVRRAWQYGLNYYAGHPLPECPANAPGLRVTVVEHQLAIERAP